MHPIRFSRRLAAAAFCASMLAAVPAAAQQHITFAGIPFGIPADSVRGMMEGRGFRHVRTFESGDMRFRTESDAVALAMVGERGLRAMMVWMPAADPAARAAAMADSLRRAFGVPVDTTGGMRTWTRGRSALTLQTGPEQPGGAVGVILFHAGPGLLDEAARQPNLAADSALAPLEPRWAVLSYNTHGARLSLDTTTIARRAGGAYRARIRIDEPLVVPDPSGRYDALVYGADYDCAGQRVQLRSRTALLRGRTVRTDQGATVWVTPRPNSQEALSLSLLCEYVDKNAVQRTTP